MRSKNFTSVKSSVKSEASLLSTRKNDAGKVLIARPLFRLARIRFDGSIAILAAAIKIDVERLENSPRLFRLPQTRIER